MGKFALFIVVINIGFIVLVELVVEARNVVLRIVWGKEKTALYRQWEKARSKRIRQGPGVSPLPETPAEAVPATIDMRSVRSSLFATLVVTILLILLQSYLTARFTLFYHFFAGYGYWPIIIVASVVSLAIHMSARHGWLMISILIGSYLLFGAILYR